MSAGRHRLPSQPLELTLVEIDDTALRLTAEGRLDADTVDDLDEAFEVVLDHPGLARLLLDLGPLASIDTTGVAALVTADRNARQRGIALSIADCSTVARQALEGTELSGYLVQERAVPHVPGPRRSDDAVSGRAAAAADQYI